MKQRNLILTAKEWEWIDPDTEDEAAGKVIMDMMQEWKATKTIKSFEKHNLIDPSFTGCRTRVKLIYSL